MSLTKSIKRLITILPVLLYAAAMAVCVNAGPNLNELKSYRCLVSDFSRTSGGYSPAITPDGNTLAYTTGPTRWKSKHDLWIMHGLKSADGKTPEPWKLEYEWPEASVMPFDYDWQTRNLDWSPDGKRLAFVGKAGHLYIAQDFDFTAQKAGRVELVAKLHPFTDEYPPHIMCPRWSPDGTHISFIRARLTEDAKICVLDTATGKETAVASDAGNAWAYSEQPWSPDGKYLTYSAGDFNSRQSISLNGDAQWKKHKDNTDHTSSVVVVSADGTQRREITSDGSSAYPSWSPSGDRIALTSPYEFSFKNLDGSDGLGLTVALWSTDIQGSDKKLISLTHAPTREQLQKFDADKVKYERIEFEKLFASKLSSSQLERLRTGEMTHEEMVEHSVLFAAEGKGEELMTAVKQGMKDMLDPATTKFSDDIFKALAPLTKEQRDSFSMKIHSFIFNAANQHMSTLYAEVCGRDVLPIWSPDGRRIAYIRKQQDRIHEELYVADLRSGQHSLVMEENGIDCVSWTGDGRFLVAQTRRTMSVSEHPMSRSTVLSYPEIWMMELK